MTYRPACPIAGCQRTCSTGKLMCPTCWGAVPPALQRRVYRAWRAFQKAARSQAVSDEYFAARRDAIESV